LINCYKYSRKLLTPVILAAKEAEIRRIKIRRQPRQDLTREKGPSQKKELVEGLKW
jgi:hypothetical protein